MIKIEVYRKIIQLVFSLSFTFILAKHDLSIIMIILCILSTLEIVLNKSMYDKLVKAKNEEQM